MGPPLPKLKRVTSADDIAAVAALAREIWNEHFPKIIGQEHVDYMLDKFQSTPAITRQIRDEGYEYYRIVGGGEEVGYFALVPDQAARSAQLSKIYVKHSARGRGLGRAALAFIEEECTARGIRELWLTVNKDNADSIAFYRRTGFVVGEPSVVDIGGGFIMDDYRMAKRLD